MRTIGDLQTDNDGLLLEDVNAITNAAGIVAAKIPQIIPPGLRVANLEEDEDRAIGLIDRKRWYRWQRSGGDDT